MGRMGSAAFLERRGAPVLGQRSWPGTCWNFFLAVPVSRSCGSIWGQIGTDLYARLVSSSDSAVPPGLPSFGALCYTM